MKRPVYRSHFDRLWKIKNFTSYLVTHHSSIHLYVHHLYSRHCFKQTKPKKTNKLTSQKFFKICLKCGTLPFFKKQPYNLFIPEFLIFGVNKLFLFMKWWSYVNNLSTFPFFQINVLTFIEKTYLLSGTTYDESCNNSPSSRCLQSSTNSSVMAHQLYVGPSGYIFSSIFL